MDENPKPPWSGRDRKLSDSDPTGRPSGVEQEAWDRILNGCATLAPHVAFEDQGTYGETYDTIHSSLVEELETLSGLPVDEARQIIDHQIHRIAALPEDFQELRATCLACNGRGVLVYHLLRYHPCTPKNLVAKCTACGAAHEVETTGTAPHSFTVRFQLSELTT